MAEQTDAPKKSIGEILQSANRTFLYLILFLVVSASLVVTQLRKVEVPTRPEPYTIEAYKILRNVPEGGVVIVDTGFTNSSRGENGGQMEALLRILMRSGAKFAVLSWVEPQCIEIARGFIRRINEERRAAGEPEYREWYDYLILGFFPDGPTMLQTVHQNVREAWKTRQATDPTTGEKRSVFESPVLDRVQRIEDVYAYVTLSASGTMPTIVARIGKQVKVISMITGVMFPEQLNYFKSGQLKGLVNGLSGCVELEWLMEKGIDAQGVVGGNAPGRPVAAAFPGAKNFDRGMAYYLALHSALTLLILAVAVGNVGMWLTNRSRKR
ncbi:MAG: hypothetical protein N2109_09120 [Fimbriimonadales bacterium]|nr:hypothetical protein [Fimbriimonadales bacterium]